MRSFIWEPKPSLVATNVQVITTVVGSLFLPEIIPAAVGIEVMKCGLNDLLFIGCCRFLN